MTSDPYVKVTILFNVKELDNGRPIESRIVMYNVLSGLAACGRLGVAARPACLFVTRSGTRRTLARRQQTESCQLSVIRRRRQTCLNLSVLARVLFSRLAGGYSR